LDDYILTILANVTQVCDYMHGCGVLSALLQQGMNKTLLL